jgi:hypothetical protein
MLVIHPFRELVHILPHTIELGMEEVDAVLTDSEPVLVDEIVAVAWWQV